MKGTNLGEFEELVLLTVGVLDGQAYSISITDEIKRVTGRNVAFGVVHSALNRLEKKGFTASKMGPSSKVRGGRRKRLFTISSAGKKALLIAKEQRNTLWQLIPESVFNKIN